MNIYRTEKEGDKIYISDKPFPKREDFVYSVNHYNVSIHDRDFNEDSRSWFSSAKAIKVAEIEREKFYNHIWLSNGMEGIEEMKAEFTKHEKSLEEGVEIDNCFRVGNRWDHKLNAATDQAIFAEPTHENATHQVIKEAMRIVSKDVREPYCVRKGLIERDENTLAKERQPETTQWVSVKTGLPKLLIGVLAISDGLVLLAHREKEMNGGAVIWTAIGARGPLQVTHWMKLPNPPLPEPPNTTNK